MRKILSVIAMILLIAGIAYGKNYEVTKKAGDFDVRVEIDKNPPVTGDNNVVIEIKDASGSYVTDAKVKVYYSMPAMPGMSAMNYNTDAVLQGSVYTATMHLSMSGPWNIAVKISSGGKRSTMKFNIDAH